MQVELHVWLQDFSWLEAGLPRKRALRQCPPGEPMFCWERALKLLYFASLAYYEQVGSRTVVLSRVALLVLLLYCRSLLSEQQQCSMWAGPWTTHPLLKQPPGFSAAATLMLQ